jgi:phenylpropionate dioxygenase-like ring-hydroxylating dioxygenase large terminal subunit
MRLSSRKYTDEAEFGHETAQLATNWILACPEVLLDKPGAFFSFTLGANQVVIENSGGSLWAHDNVCAHRFSALRESGAGRGGLVCPYHGWRYEPGGKLAIGSTVGFERSECDGARLRTFPVRAESGFVFVLPLAQTTADAELSEPVLLQNRSKATSLDCNWKIAVANTLEGYHVGKVHPETFSNLDLLEGSFQQDGANSAWTTKASAAPTWERLSKLKSKDYVHVLSYPITTVAFASDLLISIQLFEPLSVGSTRMTSWLLGTENLGSVSPSLRRAFLKNANEFNSLVFDEDAVACEAVQLGCRGANRLPGPLSSAEIRVKWFEDRITEEQVWD